VQLEGKGKTAQVYYYHLDHLGTPQELTSPHGKLVWAVQYRAYGNVVRTLANDIETPLRFQGQYYDAESGLHYNRHRYYQPNTGRFLTPDPIKLAGGLNNYQYVPNPVNWVDPLGLAGVKADCPPNGNNGSSTHADVEPEAPETRASGTHRELTNAGVTDSHHVIQDAAMKDIPSYNRMDAPTVQLKGPSTAQGSEHYKATQTQRQRGGGTYASERQIGYKALRSAGLSKEETRSHIQRADEYFMGKLNIKLNTPTRAVGNRRKK
jgi:RHS repeat-associated protein